MKIQATILYPLNQPQQITQAWEYVENSDPPALVLNRFDDGSALVVFLEAGSIVDMPPEFEIAKKAYQGKLRFEDAKLVPAFPD